MTHPYSTPMGGGEVHNPNNPPQYVNLDGELLSQGPAHTGKRVRVKSREKAERLGRFDLAGINGVFHIPYQSNLCENSEPLEMM